MLKQNMFYLLFICSYLIVCSEILFNESSCIIGTNQFIFAVHDTTRFCLWVSLSQIYEPTWGLYLSLTFFFVNQLLLWSISQTYVFLLLMSWVIRRVSIYLFSIPISLAQRRLEIEQYNDTLQQYNGIF